MDDEQLKQIREALNGGCSVHAVRGSLRAAGCCSLAVEKAALLLSCVPELLDEVERLAARVTELERSWQPPPLELAAEE